MKKDEKGWKEGKKSENIEKKYQTAGSCAQHPKASQNTHQAAKIYSISISCKQIEIVTALNQHEWLNNLFDTYKLKCKTLLLTCLDTNTSNLMDKWSNKSD